MEKENYHEKDLTDDEKLQAKFNVDSLESNIRTVEFDLKEMKMQMDACMPERQAKIAANEAFSKKGIELRKFQNQLKMYNRQIRTGKKKLPGLPVKEESPVVTTG